VNDPICDDIFASGFDTSFEFTPPADDVYRISTAGSSFDTVLSLTNTCGGFDFACNDDDFLTGAQTSLIDIFLNAGVSYIIHVDAFSDITPLNGGLVMLDIGLVPPEICDDGTDNNADGLVDCLDTLGCESDPACCPLNTITGPGVYNTTLPMDSNVNEPACGGFVGQGWDTSFEFTPPANGNYRFDTVGSSFDTVLSIDEGGCGGPELACNDNTQALQSEITASLLGGTSYIIHVDAFDFYTNQNLNGGVVQLNVAQLP
ncbi:MAG: hypothetical protein AAF211_06985, partial [Myxococcota bacterium]